MPDASQFQSHVQRLDSLLGEAEQHADPATQAVLRDLASGLLELHGQALRQILDLIAAAGEAGAPILDACARNEIVSPVLLLHGLHPLSIDARVRSAIEKVTPYLASHGGRVRIIAITPDGAVHLRLEGSCHGCPSSRLTLQSTIEQEICAAAPEVTSIVVEGLVEEAPPPPSGFVPLERLAIHGKPVTVT